MSKGRNRNRTRGGPDRGQGGRLILFGRHAVEAALVNPDRECLRLLATANMADAARKLAAGKTLQVETADAATLGQLVGPEARHQGLVLEVRPLAGAHLDEACALRGDDTNLVIVLDQVTDPHNVGAIMRSAAAFGARALITQDRHAPPESGVLAKSASGALDVLPWVRVTNLARALDELADMGYWRLGLDGESDQALAAVDLGRNIALVLGAEGRGLRHGTQEHVDALARIPISTTMESLNVSNAAAIALYELSRGEPPQA